MNRLNNKKKNSIQFKIKKQHAGFTYKNKKYSIQQFSNIFSSVVCISIVTDSMPQGQNIIISCFSNKVGLFIAKKAKLYSCIRHDVAPLIHVD